MVLAPSRGPYSRELSQASNQGKVAEHAEDEAVEERDCTARREYQAHSSSERDPCATNWRC